MTRDRLGSLRASQQGGNSDVDGPIEVDTSVLEMASFYEEVEGLRADMDNIRRVMADVGVKQSVVLSEPMCEERVKVRVVYVHLRLMPCREGLMKLLCYGLRGHVQMTSAKFSGFLTPSPHCLHFGQIHSTKLMQPPLLHLLLWYPPPTADIICTCSLSAQSKQ